MPEIKRIDDKETAILEITSFRSCLGGQHYYGTIYFYDEIENLETVSVKYPMTQEQADKLNKKDGSEGLGCYEAGEMSNRYWTEKDLIMNASIKPSHDIYSP